MPQLAQSDRSEKISRKRYFLRTILPILIFAVLAIAGLAIALGVEGGSAAAMATAQISAVLPPSLVDQAENSPATALNIAQIDRPRAIFLVQNCDDAGPGSLRDAVAAANMLGTD